ncbi:glycosyltransferase family 2 protein (plasmid) [Deinococcus taeanensis]|uniref:glycosyltransferase family 2 protein n=1 Tax=Deinococcus taeanensis TaxID=2737050 RepID=UPI001CDB661A|nr:glycosyltransferase family 2 protein [Deinococcus taeanensis]UBV44313.1 glycosyltransferase family 2 protein [Deinococcus taeanensis]
MTDPAASALPAPRVGIVVINYNGWGHTDTCLRSLAALDYPDAEVVLVDNGSTDDSVARLRERYPDLPVIWIPTNVGFTAANNVGTREALRRGADYVWFLNNDTTVDPGVLRALVGAAQASPRLGAVGSVLYCMREPEQVQGWGGGWVDLRRGRAEMYQAPVSSAQLDFLSGTSLLVRRAALEEVGLLDERYFMYWEDADFSFRLRRAGWQLGVADTARTWHLGAASMGLSTLNHKSLDWELNFTKSAVRFFLRHSTFPVAPLLAGPGLYLVKRLLRGQWPRAAAVARGGWLAFRRAAQ